jgi:hypothetical protein
MDSTAQDAAQDTAKKIRSTLQSRKDAATFYMKNRSTVLEKRKAAYNASVAHRAQDKPQYDTVMEIKTDHTVSFN